MLNTILRSMKSFAAFWYDFLVGDDWYVALGVVLSLTVTTWLTHLNSAPWWWLLPLYVLIALPLSLRRATRKQR